ncbi:MAG: chemotaxis protein CheW [Verrucomicrobiaceae bacterium]|nr:chemotaxis protein CheW [Verrucomicrobiaceae bacterium]
MSRTCGGAVIWDDVEKEALRRVLWRLSEFTGVRILTYCVMHNHFHVLAEVPNRESWLEQRFSGPEGEARLLRHLRILYSRSYIESLQVELAEWRKCGQERLAQERLEGIRRRFCDLTVFIKEVKERFSRWYNKRHQRKGTLWMDRFKSVLVEGRDEPLLTMALYIDLNPVRAGICADPQNYRWCGYAEALAGDVACQRGICRVMAHDEDAWLRHSVGEGYRRMLFDTAVEVLDDEGKVVRSGITRRAAEDVLLTGGKLSRGDLIRHRVRYFSDGVALGGRDFVEAVFRRRRRQFSPQRKNGARHLAEADGQLFSLRNLRVRPIG